MANPKELSRREFLKVAGVASVALGLAGGLGGAVAACGSEGETTTTGATTTTTTAGETPTTLGTPTTLAAVESLPNPDNWKPANFLEAPNPKEALKTSFEHGKYETFPRQVMATDTGLEGQILQHIDIGTLGPDVDAIVGVDFPGLIKSGAGVVHFPKDGQPTETRVVFIKRTDLEYVQIKAALGGDRFDVYKTSEDGGDKALDVTARMHAFNTAREHQIVYYLGDLGLFQRQWGAQEQELLQRMERAQRPSQANIPEPDFVQSRIFVPTGK